MAANLITPAYERDAHPAFLELAPPHFAARSLAYAHRLAATRGRCRAKSTRMRRINCAETPKKCARFCHFTLCQSISRI